MRKRLSRAVVKSKVVQPCPAKGKRSATCRPRQAITPWAITLRMRDVLSESIRDTRRRHLVVHAWHSLVSVLLLGLATAAKSMRTVEKRTQSMSLPFRRLIGLTRAVSDTTLHNFLCDLERSDVVGMLRQLVKAEWKRGGLRPSITELSVVAFDGKKLVTYRADQVLRMANEKSTRPLGFADVDAIRRCFREHYPTVQISVEETGGKPRLSGKIMAHRATLVSHPASPCMALEAIPGDTNEVGHAPGFLRRLMRAYSRTGMVEVVIADAGNCSQEIGETIVQGGADYVLRIKDNQQDAMAEAERLLGGSRLPPIYEPTPERVNGTVVHRRVWWVDARELLARFPHATRLVRVEREVRALDGTMLSRGNRYFVTSLNDARLTPKEALTITRAYWRCENCGHWVADTQFNEDKTGRAVFSRKPEQVEIVAILRAVAQSIVGILRCKSKGTTEKQPVPSWSDCIEHVMRAMTGAIRIRLTHETPLFHA